MADGMALACADETQCVRVLCICVVQCNRNTCFFVFVFVWRMFVCALRVYVFVSGGGHFNIMCIYHSER